MWNFDFNNNMNHTQSSVNIIKKYLEKHACSHNSAIRHERDSTKYQNHMKFWVTVILTTSYKNTKIFSETYSKSQRVK